MQKLKMVINKLFRDKFKSLDFELKKHVLLPIFVMALIGSGYLVWLNIAPAAAGTWSTVYDKAPTGWSNIDSTTTSPVFLVTACQQVTASSSGEQRAINLEIQASKTLPTASITFDSSVLTLRNGRAISSVSLSKWVKNTTQNFASLTESVALKDSLSYALAASNATKKVTLITLSFNGANFSSCSAPAVTASASSSAPKTTSASEAPAATPANLSSNSYVKDAISPVGVQATANLGYWLVASNGSIYSYGDQFKGLVPDSQVGGNNIVGIAAPANYSGYWIASNNGSVYSYGVPFKGSLPAIGAKVNDIVGIAAAPSGNGYWLVGADGGVFAFGAPFKNSLPGIHIKTSSIVGIASSPSGGGYYLVSSDGSVYAFGDAKYSGGMNGKKHQPIVGIAVDPSGGYWLVASDGGVFAFGGASFYGSWIGHALTGRVVGLSPSSDGKGYYLAASDGSVLAFGDAQQQNLGASIAAHIITPNACNAPGNTAVPDPYPTWNYPPPMASSSSVPEIKIANINGAPTLVNSANMQPFVVRGANYVRLANSLSGKQIICGHATFDTGPTPDHYNFHEAAQALALMHQLGYNTVKVGIDPVEVGNPHGAGLDPAYLANLANFINLARANQLRVWLNTTTLPLNGGYIPASYYDKKSPQFRNINDYFVPSTNFIPVEQRFVADLLTGLKNQGADMSNVLSYEIWGEQAFDVTKWPIDSEYAHHNYGQIDSYLVNWENKMTSTVHKVMPKLLTSISFYPPGNPPGTSPKLHLVEAQKTFSSNVDFIDLHLYPVSDKPTDLAGLINIEASRFGFPSNHPKKPVVLGEFGSFKNQPASTPEQAADLLTNWAKDSCKVPDLHIRGWIIWTWDIAPWEQNSLYNLQDSFYTKASGTKTLAEVLSPSQLADPCK